MAWDLQTPRRLYTGKVGVSQTVSRNGRHSSRDLGVVRSLRRRGNFVLVIELDVDSELVRPGKAALVLVVAVAEIVAVAATDEGPAAGVIGNDGAAVRGPVQVGGVAAAAFVKEGSEGAVPHERVGGRHLGVVALALLDRRGLLGGGGESAVGQEAGGEDGGQLHGEGVVVL